MNLEETAPVIVTLSRRNLNSLLEMLDHNVGMPSLRRETALGRLIVRAEEDEEHYAGRESEKAA